jgi:hypothetical protein
MSQYLKPIDEPLTLPYQASLNTLTSLPFSPCNSAQHLPHTTQSALIKLSKYHGSSRGGERVACTCTFNIMHLGIEHDAAASLSARILFGRVVVDRQIVSDKPTFITTPSQLDTNEREPEISLLLEYNGHMESVHRMYRYDPCNGQLVAASFLFDSSDNEQCDCM